MRGQPGCSPLLTVIGSAGGDSVASQSRYSMPTVSDFTSTAASEGALLTVEIQPSVVARTVVGSRSAEVLSPALAEDDVPLATSPRSSM